MQHFDFQSLMEMQSVVLPLAVLAIENDDDRDFMTEIYLRYRPLMHKTAARYFSSCPQDTEEAVSDALENLCRYIHRIRALAEADIPKYIVIVVRNACNGILRKRNPAEKTVDFLTLEDTADESPLLENILSKAGAQEILDSFAALSTRDKALIRLRHIDLMEYEDIAATLGISVSNARTALHRAKRRLEQSLKNRPLDKEV